ncbi:MAG: hypothetical protein JWM46_323, partial [Candidatus Kaiserbacteria bacterium]|nr:hypothetical protein [Candidatus Kaiserbacteria bacterium]
MEIVIVVLLIAILLGIIILAYVFLGKQAPSSDPQSMILLQNQIQDLSRSLEQKLGEGTRNMFDSMKSQFSESQRLATDIRDVVHKQ